MLIKDEFRLKAGACHTNSFLFLFRYDSFKPNTSNPMSFHDCSMDKNGTMAIEWNEWWDYHLLHPADNIPEIIQYWKHATVHVQPSSI